MCSVRTFSRYVTFSLSLAHRHSTYSEIRIASFSFRPSVKRFNTSSATRGGMTQSPRTFFALFLCGVRGLTRVRIFLPDFFPTSNLLRNGGQFIVSGNVTADRAAIHPRYIMLNIGKMARTIDISGYALKNLKNLSVFRLEARPNSSPVDVNLGALLDESSWNLSDRLRFWHTIDGASPLSMVRLTIRKLDLDEKALVHCQIDAGGTLTILSNSKDYATRFFRGVFTDGPPTFAGVRNWKVK